MATINDVIGGLQIFAKYCGDKHNMGASHDILYVGAGVEPTAEEVAELEKYGWHFDTSADSWARFI